MTNTASLVIKPASLGSISHGTLRTEDLLSALGDELESQILRNGHFFAMCQNREERDRLNQLHGNAVDCFDADGQEIEEDKQDDAQELVNDIQDALSMFAPAYCYFGAHEGNGSDFGYWPSHDAIEELPTVEGSDEAKELGEDCKSVNDRGNVTVYGADGFILLDLV